MKSIVLSLLTVTAFFSAPALSADNPSVEFIRGVGAKALELGALSDRNAKHRGFCSLVKRSVSVDSVLPVVLDRYYQQATRNQLAELKGFIEELLVAQLSKAFDRAAGGRLNVESRVIDSNSRSDVNPLGVNAQLFNSRGHRVHKFYFIVQGHNKILDARIDNFQVSRFLKNEYTSYMNRHGGNSPVGNLLDHLAGQNPTCP